MQFIAESTSTLRSLTDSRADLDVVLGIRAGDSHLAFPGLPPDAKLDLTKLTGSGTGSQSVDLGSLTSAVNQKLGMDMEMQMSMPQMGSKTPMVMSMHMDQDISTAVVNE